MAIDPVFQPYIQQQPQSATRVATSDPLFDNYLQPQVSTRVDRSQLPPVEEDPESILSQMGSTVISGLAAAGNLFDLPGSSIRDVASSVATGRWENPFDQWATPFSAENRKTGRDVLADWELTSPNDPNRWEWADVAGFGAEVAMDPFTWIAPTAVAKGAGKFVPKPIKSAVKNSAVGKAAGAAGRTFKRHFDASVLGRTSEAGQAWAKDLSKGLLRAERSALADALPAMHSIDPAELGDVSRQMREYIERAADPDFDAASIPQAYRDIADYMVGNMQARRANLEALGANTKHLKDTFILPDGTEMDLGYMFRQMNPELKSTMPKSQSGPGSLVDVFDPSSIERKEWLKGWRKGTTHVDHVVTDPELNDIVKAFDGKNGSKSDAVEAVRERLVEKYGDDIDGNYYSQDPETGDWFVDGEEGAKYADIAQNIVESEAMRKYGVFGNNVIMDYFTTLRNMDSRAATIESTFKAMQQPGALTNRTVGTFRKIGDEQLTTVSGLLQKIDVQVDEGVKKIFGDGLKKSQIDKLKKTVINEDLANDLMSTWKYFDVPDEISDIGKFTNSITSLFKAGVLTHPGRYTRDLFSGQIRNIERGMWSPKDMKLANEVLLGGAPQELVHNEVVQAWLGRNGREVTPENAAMAVREMAAAGIASSVRQGTDMAFGEGRIATGAGGEAVTPSTAHRDAFYSSLKAAAGGDIADTTVAAMDARAAHAVASNPNMTIDDWYRESVKDVQVWETAEAFERAQVKGAMYQGRTPIGGQGLDIRATEHAGRAKGAVEIWEPGKDLPTGEIMLNTQTPHQEDMIRKMFNVPKSEDVTRISGIWIDESLRGQGVGKRLYLELADGVDGWIWNNQSSDDAIRTLDSLEAEGLIEVKWNKPKNRTQDQHRIMRITDKGRDALNEARSSTAKPKTVQPDDPAMPGYTLYQGADDLGFEDDLDAMEAFGGKYDDEELALDFGDSDPGVPPVTRGEKYPTRKVDAFYSLASRVADDLPDRAMDLQELKGTLKKRGVKQDEMDWLDLETAYEMSGKKKLSKEEVREWVSDEGVQLEEQFVSGNYRTIKGAEGVLPTTENVREINLKLKGYQLPSMHHDNSLAYVRVGDQITQDGKKILMMENVQSDFLQGNQGNLKKGEYWKKVDATATKADEALALQEQYRRQSRELVERRKGLQEQRDALPRGPEREALDQEIFDVTRELETVGMRELEARAASKRRGVDVSELKAPFQKNWHELLMKRVLKYAADNGYDGIAWTPAAIQKQRWGSYANGTNAKFFDILYDEKMPSFAKKYSKKMGGNFGNVDIKHAIGNADLEEGASRLSAFQSRINQINDRINQLPDEVEYRQLLSERDRLSHMVADIDARINQQSLPSILFDDAARKSYQEKQPLFQAKGKRGAVSFDDGNKATIHWFKNASDASTAAHEVGHIFRRDLSRYAPELHDRAARALGVKDGNWTRQAEEKFAEQWESYLKTGKAPTSTLKAVFDQFKDWLTNIYKNLTGQQPEAVSADLKAVFDEMLTAPARAPRPERGLDALQQMIPGSALGAGSTMRQAGDIFSTAIGRDPASTYNPLDVRGNAFGNAGEVRTESRFAPVLAGDKVGEWSDGLNRLTPLLNRLRRMTKADIEKAGSVEDLVFNTMDDIQAMQIDYSGRNFTRTEQTLKQLFPFYSFFKGNMAYVASELAGGRPQVGTFAPGAGLRSNIRAGRLATGEDDGYAPQYVSETTSMGLGELADGSRRYLTGLGLMHEDPFSMFTVDTQTNLPDLSDTLIETMSRMNPLLKAPVEWATGESFFQRGPMGGRDLGDMDPLMGRLVSNVGELAGFGPREDINGRAKPIGGDLLEHIVANSPVSRILSTARQLTDQRKWESTELPGIGEVPALGVIANTLTGARVTDISLPAQQATLGDKASAYARENLGASVYQNVYIPKEVIAEYEKTDPQKARQAKVFNKAKQIFKKKREEREGKTRQGT